MKLENSFEVVPQTGLPVWGSYSFQRVASLGRMILPLSPGLHPTLGALGRMSLHLSATLGALGRMNLQLTLVSHTRLPHLSFTLVSHSGCLGPHEFTLVFCLPHLSPTLGALGRMSLHLSPTCPSHLSPPLGALGRMSLHLSPTCLPHLSPTLGALGRMSVTPVCHSGCLGPHEFTAYTCLPHSSPTLVFHTCLAPTLGALGRMSLHLSPTCLPLWVPWAA